MTSTTMDSGQGTPRLGISMFAMGAAEDVGGASGGRLPLDNGSSDASWWPAERSLRLLLVEDCDDDAFLLYRRLSRGGYRLDFHRVATSEDLRAALVRQPWDIVIADYGLPGLEFWDVFRDVRSHDEQVPFIVISGMMRADVLTNAASVGIEAFIPKQSLSELLPTIARVLRATDGGAMSSRAVPASVTRTADLYRATFEEAAVGIVHVGEGGRWLRVNGALCELLGYTKEEALKVTMDTVAMSDDGAPCARACGRTCNTRERLLVRADGRSVWVNCSSSSLVESADGQDYRVMVLAEVGDRSSGESGPALRASDAGGELSSQRSMVAFLDAQWNFQYVNSRCEALFELPQHRIVGSRLQSVVRGSQFDGLVERLRKAPPGEHIDVLLHLSLPSGGRVFGGTITSQCGADGRVSGFFCVLVEDARVGSSSENLPGPTASTISEVRVPGPAVEEPELVAVRPPASHGSARPQHEPVGGRLQPRGEDELGRAILGASKAMRRVRDLARLVVGTSTTVVLQGETGTGKSQLARLIHRQSLSRERPFVTVDCAAVATSLIESELFGHERGAFTGAVRRHAGALETSDSGTLFFDELGDLPLAAQGKLLRALEEKVFRRVGGTEDIPLKARIIVASRQSLARLVSEGRFREDLYYRVAVFAIKVPALRDRMEDIVPIANMFLRQFQREGRARLAFASEAEGALQHRAFPGNVRELRNMVERLVLAHGDAPEPIRLEEVEACTLTLPPPMVASETLSEVASSQRVLVSDDESRRIADALVAAGGRIGQAAKLLGLSRHALRRRLAKLRDN